MHLTKSPAQRSFIERCKSAPSQVMRGVRGDSCYPAEEKDMARSIVLFAALFFTALVAGGAFVIWIDYNPAGMSATFYVEKMQHAIRVFTAPLPTIVILSVLATAASAFLARRERRGFYLLIAASL